MISNSQAITVTPTVQAAAYASGNVIGGLLTLSGAARASGWGGLVQSASVAFASGVTPAVDIVIFSSSPTGSTVTDKTALAIATADLPKVQGVMHLTDVTSLGTPSFIQSQQQAMPFDLTFGTALYAAVVARAGVTLGSASDMTVTIQVLQN